MSDERRLEPVAFHRALAEALERSEPGLWRWIASEDYWKKYGEAVKLELLRTTYRLSREGHETLYAAVEEVSRRLGIDAPATLYQLQQGEPLNAVLVYVPGEVHVVLSGRVQELLSPVELRALLGHELAHFLLFNREGGRFHVASELLSNMVRTPRHAPSHASSFRRYNLWMEFFADRGALEACGDLNAAVSCLVKMETGLTTVDAAAYLKQADEALEGTKGSQGVTHPESFLRAWALKHWHSGGADAALERLADGALSLQTLDLVQQHVLTQTTQALLRQVLAPEWMRTDATLAHARRFFPAVDLTGSAATVKLPAGDTSLEEYFSYVLLDFAMVDADLEDQALSRLAHLASAFGLEETFARIARKELRLSASSYAELKARGATIEEKGVTA